MPMARRTRLLIASLCVVSGCTASPSVLLVENQQGALRTLQSITASDPLAEGQPKKATSLARGEYASSHVVQIRDREDPHVHAKHDLSVTLIEGSGELYLAGTRLVMRAGDSAFIPRGVPHYFVNTGADVAVAVATYAPPFDGRDSVPVEPR